MDFSAQWTPTAVLINRDGTIASHTAVGDKAIRELMEQIKEKIDDPDVLLISTVTDNQSSEHFYPNFHRRMFSRKISARKICAASELSSRSGAYLAGFATGCLKICAIGTKRKARNEPNLLLLSEGEAERHRKLDLQSPIVLDKDRKISKELGMIGTPSAVLINENGKIISETAIGAIKSGTY
jgi:hypothetical protein